MFFGALLVILGAIFLLQNLGLLPEESWSVVWPVFIIALGISVLAKKDNGWCWCGKCDSKKS